LWLSNQNRNTCILEIRKYFKTLFDFHPVFWKKTLQLEIKKIGSEAFIVVNMKSAGAWVVTPCNVEKTRRLGETYPSSGGKLILLASCFSLFPAWLTIRP
jgi:hypothetical protein